LNLDPDDPALRYPTNWDETFVNRRRHLADLLRLQINGLLWAATGIDQYYPEDYERAQIDLDADEKFHEFTPDVSLSVFSPLKFSMPACRRRTFRHY
jgi:hypothetical protein